MRSNQLSARALAVGRFFGHRWAVVDMPYPLYARNQNNTAWVTVKMEDCVMNTNEDLRCMTV